MALCTSIWIQAFKYSLWFTVMAPVPLWLTCIYLSIHLFFCNYVAIIIFLPFTIYNVDSSIQVFNMTHNYVSLHLLATM